MNRTDSSVLIGFSFNFLKKLKYIIYKKTEILVWYSVHSTEPKNWIEEPNHCCYFYLTLQLIFMWMEYWSLVMYFEILIFHILWVVNTLLVVSKILVIKWVLNTLYLLLIFVMKLGWINCWKKWWHYEAQWAKNLEIQNRQP